MSDNFASEPEDGLVPPCPFVLSGATAHSLVDRCRIMGMGYASISSIRPRRQSDATSKPFGLRIAKVRRLNLSVLVLRDLSAFLSLSSQTSDGPSELFLGGPNPDQFKVSRFPITLSSLGGPIADLLFFVHRVVSNGTLFESRRTTTLLEMRSSTTTMSSKLRATLSSIQVCLCSPRFRRDHPPI